MAQTHASKEQIPAQKMGDYEGRMQQFGDYYVNFESMPAGLGGRRFSRVCPTTPAKLSTGDTSSKGRLGTATRTATRIS
jgi:hypothetical protein